MDDDWRPQQFTFIMDRKSQQEIDKKTEGLNTSRNRLNCTGASPDNSRTYTLLKFLFFSAF